MIISCPACAAQYELPDDAIGDKGRRVKCTSCAHTWLQPPAGADKIEFIQEQIAENFDSKPATSTQVPIVRSGRWGGVAATAAGLAVILLLCSLAFLIPTRRGMTAGWPPMALFYQTMGLSVPAPGAQMVFQDVTSKMEDGTLSVKGKVKNPTKTEQILGGLNISVSGPTGQLKDWLIELHNKPLQAEEEISFEYKLPDVPKGAENVTVRFAE